MIIPNLSQNLKETPEIDRIYQDNKLEIFVYTPKGIDWKNNLYLITRITDKESRISMLSANYIESELENYILSKDEIQYLINCLNSHRDGDDCDFNDNITIWQLGILSNNIYRMLDDKIPMDLQIPDYMQLIK